MPPWSLLRVSNGGSRFLRGLCHDLALSFFGLNDAPHYWNHPYEKNEKEDNCNRRSVAYSHVVNALMHDILHYGCCCVLWAALSHDLHLRIEFKGENSGCDQHEDHGITQLRESNVPELAPMSSAINPGSFVQRFWNSLHTSQVDYHLETDPCQTDNNMIAGNASCGLLSQL